MGGHMADSDAMNKEYAASLRERFNKNGSADFTDRELLCLLLSFTNVKNKLVSVADALEERFGDANHCYTASYSELMDVEGMTRHSAVMLMLMGRLAALRSDSVSTARVSGEYEEQFLTILRYTMREELWAAAIDDDGDMRALERLSCGSDMSVDISAGALMRFAVKSGAKRVIIAHSHPGSAEPAESQTDIYSRKHLAAALATAGVTLEGQVIVAGGKARMYRMGQTE